MSRLDGSEGTAQEPRVVLRTSVTLELAHGDDVEETLAAHGHRLLRVRAATRSGPHELTLDLETSPMPPAARPPHPPRRDPDITDADVAAAVRRRRIAAYALVRHEDCVLLTVLSARAVSAPGSWALPGGGLDPGEDPRDALVREVWEETGQRVEDVDLVAVTTDHWIGRSPTGVVEDFQPIRLVYRATCPEPTEPVVHDVGGTTHSAAWVPLAEARRPGFTTSKRTLAVLDLL